MNDAVELCAATLLDAVTLTVAVLVSDADDVSDALALVSLLLALVSPPLALVLLLLARVASPLPPRPPSAPVVSPLSPQATTDNASVKAQHHADQLAALHPVLIRSLNVMLKPFRAIS